MIEREITSVLLKLFQQYPFVTLTGPRQSGKTTLCRAAFPQLKNAWSSHPSSISTTWGWQADRAGIEIKDLIGIEHAAQLSTHPLRGPLFENAVVVEALKHRFNRGLRSNLSFFRSTQGLECDLLVETGNGIGAIEIKAGATIGSDYFHALNRVAELIPQISTRAVVYGGTDRQSRSDGEAIPLADLGELLDRLENGGSTPDGFHGLTPPQRRRGK